MVSSNELPTIVTLLSPSERNSLDAVGQGCFATLHRDCVDDIVKDLRRQPVHAVLVSVSYATMSSPRVDRLVREFPRIPAFALLSEVESRTPQTVLTLGRYGICRVVDVRLASGWREMRSALMADTGASGQRKVLSQLETDLAGCMDDCWLFFKTLFSCQPRIASVRLLCRQFGVLPSTMMSRFYRAGLPAPKQYLSMARLVRSAYLFENDGFSIANVANHLDYSSPQSFGRHMRATMSMTASEFRLQYSGVGMLERFREELIIPYISILRCFHPLQAIQDIGHSDSRDGSNPPN